MEAPVACNIDWIQIIGIVVAALIPVLIMVITLRAEKQRHIEQIKELQEKNRIDALPVFVILTSVENEYRDNAGRVDEVGALMSFKNTGNGTAINLKVEGAETTINGAISPGEDTEAVRLRMYRNSEQDSFCVRIHFMDLYENIYSEELYIDYSLSDTKALEMMVKGISCPKIIEAW